MRKMTCVRLVLSVLLMIASAVVLGQQGALAVSQDDVLYPWLGSGGVSIMSRSQTIKEKLACSNKSETVVFRSGFSALACVYGDADSTRIASYVNQGGLPVIGVAFPGDEKYSEVRGVCEGSSVCAYSASRDILVDSQTSRFYLGFTEKLTKMTNPINGLPYYQFSRSDLNRYIKVSGPMSFNAAAVSINGKWAVVEAYNYGFVRVDLDTFHERRIAISGARYGQATDPGYELAISNSGREFAAVGYRTGISLYQIDNYCGDVLGEGSAYYFMNPTVPCRQTPLTTDLFPGFVIATSPVFSSDGTRIGLTVQTTAKKERIIFGPTATVSVGAEAVRYMAVGDSYSSGEGEIDNAFYKHGTDQNTNKCHLSSRSYPYLLTSQWGITSARSIACSGAQTKDVFGAGLYYGQKNQVAKTEPEKSTAEVQALVDFMPGVVRQVDFVGKYQPRFITVGIGGNDAGVMDKLNACVGVGVCEWAKNPAKRLASAKEIQGLLGNVRGAIAAVRTASPEAKLLFIGYPRIISEAPSAPCSLLLGTLLSSEERQFMDESIKVLNDTVRAAATAEGVQFIDIQDVFVGHRLCEGDGKAMNGVRAGNDIAPIKNLSIIKMVGSESFHPTPYGHSLIAARVAAQVPDPSLSCAACTEGITQGSATLGVLSSYWTESVDSSQVKKLVMRQMMEDVIYKAGDRAVISVPGQQFRPQSSAMVEIHSEPKNLGVMSVDDVGSGSKEVIIPDDIEDGYHTVHVTGESWSGDSIDVYQVIRVAGSNVDTADDSVGVGGNGDGNGNGSSGSDSGGSSSATAGSTTVATANSSGIAGGNIATGQVLGAQTVGFLNSVPLGTSAQTVGGNNSSGNRDGASSASIGKPFSKGRDESLIRLLVPVALVVGGSLIAIIIGALSVRYYTTRRQAKERYNE